MENKPTLREQIELILLKPKPYWPAKWYKQGSDQILNLIKEAGYKSPEEIKEMLDGLTVMGDEELVKSLKNEPHIKENEGDFWSCIAEGHKAVARAQLSKTIKDIWEALNGKDS